MRSKQTCLTLALYFLIAKTTVAAVPLELGYQAYVTDSSGAPLNGTIDVMVSLYDDPVSSGQGAARCIEEHDNVPVSQGLFHLQIGTGVYDPNGDPLDADLNMSMMYFPVG